MALAVLLGGCAAGTETQGDYSGAYLKRTVIVVSDIERALLFWRDILGFSVNYRNDTFGPFTYELLAVPEGAQLRIATLDAGDAQRRAIALFEIREPALSPLAGVRRSITVVDANGRFDEIVERALAIGYRATSVDRFDVIGGGAGIERGLTDPDGNMVLIYQVADDARPNRF